jgi:hypothetical protein
MTVTAAAAAGNEEYYCLPLCGRQLLLNGVSAWLLLQATNIITLLLPDALACSQLW